MAEMIIRLHTDQDKIPPEFIEQLYQLAEQYDIKITMLESSYSARLGGLRKDLSHLD